ncbi:hypothetical protein J0L40_00795 [Stenotrophomonas maltophilia]|nr:hypothetical protein [Stenotrophomonas maltophilia]
MSKFVPENFSDAVSNGLGLLSDDARNELARVRCVDPHTKYQFDFEDIVGNGLGKVDTALVEVWKTAPRVNGSAGRPYHRSIWSQEVTVFQSIPERAIIGAIE